MTNTNVKPSICHKLLSNVSLGNDKPTFKSSYYTDYVQGHDISNYTKTVAAKPPPCAKVRDSN